MYLHNDVQEATRFAASVLLALSSSKKIGGCGTDAYYATVEYIMHTSSSSAPNVLDYTCLCIARSEEQNLDLLKLRLHGPCLIVCGL